jgi:hypothetical protein
MAQIADFSIIADNWVLEKDQNTINFNVPSNIDTKSSSVLGFMVQVQNLDSLTLKLHLNGTEVWNWNFSDGKRTQFFQEVIGGGLLKSGNNVFSFQSSTDDFHLVKLSDVVIWWQANI